MLVKLTNTINFINILLSPLAPIFCTKKLQSQNITIEKLEEALLYKKNACKILVKLTPIVNFINILQAAVCQYSFAKKLQSQTEIREKLPKAFLHEKFEHKMLMKLKSSLPCNGVAVRSHVTPWLA